MVAELLNGQGHIRLLEKMIARRDEQIVVQSKYIEELKEYIEIQRELIHKYQAVVECLEFVPNEAGHGCIYWEEEGWKDE